MIVNRDFGLIVNFNLILRSFYSVEIQGSQDYAVYIPETRLNYLMIGQKLTETS